jgi:hypothetical protein
LVRCGALVRLWKAYVARGSIGSANGAVLPRCSNSSGLSTRHADINPAIRDQVYHSTPIGWACHFSQSDSVELLIDRAGINDAVGCD